MLGLLFLVGILALYFGARSYGRLAADRSFDRLLAGSAISITETLAVTDDEILVDIPYAALEMLSAAPDDRVFYAVTTAGRTVTGYDDLPIPGEHQTAASGRSSDSIRFFDAEYRGEKVRFVTVGREIVQFGAKGWVWVQVGQTRLARDAVARETIVRDVAPIAAMTVLALGLVWFGIASTLRPLRDIGEELAQRLPSELHPLDARVPPEIRPLIVAINGFMVRLSENIGTLKAFIADASHQMRTPLAALIAQAHVAPHENTAELRRSLAAIERNGAKLAHLLNQLLSDATINHRADVRRFEPLDLLDVLREAIGEATRAWEESDVRLKTSVEKAPALGDSVMLVEAFKNLIHNSICHGGGLHDQVEVQLTPNALGYAVSVSDRGPGISAAIRPRVFERFFRGNPEAPGAGIGLAIVKRAIESHGGTIELLDRGGGGLCVLVGLQRNGV